MLKVSQAMKTVPDLPSFPWIRFLGEEPFELRRAALRGDSEFLHNHKAGEQPLALVPRPGARSETYYPLQEATGLFRTFADTEPSQDGIMEFARKYGLLGDDAQVWMIRFADEEPSPAEPERFGEPLVFWRARIRWMKFLVQLWDAARQHDLKCLAEHIAWSDRHEVSFHIPADMPALRRIPHPSLKERHKDGGDGFEGSFIERGTFRVPRQSIPNVQPGDLIGPAFFLTGTILSDRIKGLVSPQICWVSNQGRAVLQISPSSLLGAIYLQFAQAIDGSKDFRRCRACGVWFELSPGVNRSNRLTCSPACRTRAHRERQARARELYAQGVSVREIAKELESGWKKVQKWVTDPKG